MLRAGLVGLLCCLCAQDLASESVTLTTYYPAPSGIYTKMITTGQTMLARDSGYVGVHTSSPQQMLDVNGNIRFGGMGGLLYGYSSGGYHYMYMTENDGNGGPNDWMYIMPSWYGPRGHVYQYTADSIFYDGSGVMRFTGGRLAVGAWSASSRLDVGNGAVRSAEANGAGCYQLTYFGGRSYCASGYYATYTTGIWAGDSIQAGPGGLNGFMYCCLQQ